MTSRIVLPCLLLLAAATGSLVGADKHEPAAAGKSPVGFDKFKQLVGEWEGKETGEDGHPLVVKYKLTSGGSTVEELLMPGTDHEMVTMIHPDGADLLLTHYCMLGNQPQMRASAKPDNNKVEFKFVRATNMKSDKEMHMHDATYTFVDKDTLKTEWTNYDDGKLVKTVTFELKRKK